MRQSPIGDLILFAMLASRSGRAAHGPNRGIRLTALESRHGCLVRLGPGWITRKDLLQIDQ
ncbi:MAG: hypothetical protein WCP62_15625 [Planctomycetota bacterium]